MFDIVNVVEAIDSCKSACTLMSLTVQSLFLRASEIVSDHVLKMVDYLAFSETWELNEVTTDVPGFICIAKAKRPNARAAGVAVFQNSSATTTAVSHSIRKFCARNDVELDRSDEYGDICLAEITITDKRALLFCLYISPGMQPNQTFYSFSLVDTFYFSIDFTIKQKKFFLARNLFLYSRDDMPMVVTGNFNIDLSREENFHFVDFMRKYLRLELASDPTKATTLGGSCVDLTFIRNIRLDSKLYYSCFFYHRPILSVLEC